MSINKTIESIEQELIQAKTTTNTRADSSRWHQTTLTYTFAYPQADIYQLRFAPVDGNYDELIVTPVYTAGRAKVNASSYSMSDIYTSEVDVLVAPNDPCSWTVIINNIGAEVLETHFPPSLTLYSNRKIVILQNEKLN